MGLYARYVLPRLIDAAMDNAHSAAERSRVVPRASGTVLEVGAGSGLNLPFYGPGVVKLYALDPSADVWRLGRERARRAPFPVEFVQSSAERVPLPDGSADVVTCAQAFHWFDQERALPEIARVLRPGGRIALVWNTRDDSQGWVAELTETVIGRSEFRDHGVIEVTKGIDDSGLYGPVERASFTHVQLLGRDDLVELVRSRSQCAVLPEDERRPVLERVGAMFDAHSRDGVLAMPYVTECFRAARR